MGKVAFVQLSVGGQIDHVMADLPHDGGRWDTSTTPAVVIYDSSGGELIASTAASTGPTTRLSTSTAAGVSTLPITSTSGWQRFEDVVIGPNIHGQWEWVTIVGVKTTALTIAPRTQYAYSTSDVVKSHRLFYAVAATTAAEVDRLRRAEWRYVVDGVERRESTEFHVSRYAPRLSLTAAAFLQEYPRGQRMIASHQDLDLLIRRVWFGRVLPDIARMIPPGAVASGAAIEAALIERVKAHLSEEAKDHDSADRYLETYKAELDGLRASLVDTDEDGSVDDTEIMPSVRTPRISRC